MDAGTQRPGTDSLPRETVAQGGDAWRLTYRDWIPEQQPLREALCTLGNGYVATRGAAEDAAAGGVHYPGTYLAGGYNRLETEIAGRLVENEDLVNWPNWLSLSFRHDEGDWFATDRVELLSYRQELDLRVGTLVRVMRFRDAQGRETTLASRRLVHMGDPHLAVIEWELTPDNWDGVIHLQSALDGKVINDGVARYRDFHGKHLTFVDSGHAGEEGIYLLVETCQSGVRMAQAARSRVYLDGARAAADRAMEQESSFIAHTLDIECTRKRPIRVEKVVALYTSRDHAISEPRDEACRAVGRAPSFSELLTTHARTWHGLWHRCDIRLDGRPTDQLALRLHIFHLLQTVSINSIDLDVGVPARGLHGEAYRGHVFWDELYIFPFLNLRIPEVTRALLMYRYRRLPEARRAALAAGYRGALFPWQSGSNGREESQILHLNPRSGRWLPDHTSLQRHVNAAIAFNVWEYFQATGDRPFLAFHGAEIILEIAAFWASAATFNAERQRYELRGVVGPDEYHTAYPDRDDAGLDNNAYTNIMASWVITCALRVLDLLAEDRRAELLEALEITDDDLARWDDISRRMFVPFHEDGIISQFEGYEELKEFDWDSYLRRYGDIQRLDRILEAEGDAPNRYRAAKQADVLMLFYLFSTEELTALFGRLKYRFEPDMIRRNIEYYIPRTSHGSTLSRLVHSWVLARSDRERAWRWFQEALKSDLSDIQGGTTPEGIHLGAMAGTVDLVQRCYSGIELRDGILWLNPCLPDELNTIQSRIRYHGHWFSLTVDSTSMTLVFEKGWTATAKIGFRGDIYTLQRGDTRRFDL